MFQDYFRDFIFYLEIVCAIVATVTYKSYKNTPSKYLLHFFWFTVIVETLGLIRFYNYYYPDNNFIIFLNDTFPKRFIENNLWLYNMFTVITYLIYLNYIYRLVTNVKRRKIIFFFIIIFLSIVIVDFILNYNLLFTNYFFWNRIAGSLLFLLSLFIYLFEVFNSNEILTFHKTRRFWLLFGVLIFNLTTVPIFIFSNQLGIVHPAYRIILSSSNIVLYGSSIIGFIIGYRNYLMKK